MEDFEKARVDIAVADNDQSTLSHALTDYLKTIHNVSEISSDPSVMQEELFYRNAEYIVQIPKDFYKTCIVQDNPIFRHKDFPRILYFILYRPADQCMAE